MIGLTVAPVLLWAAGLLCAAIGLSARRIGAPGAPERPAASTVPAVLRVAARVPCPVAAARRLCRESDPVDIGRAGLSDRLTTEGLARMRAGLALCGVALGACLALASPIAIASVPLLGGVGAAAPGRWIVRRQRARRRALVRELPDLLDLLGICIEAGMALDPALHLAAERLGGTLGEEVGIVLRDLSLGSPRRSAYRDLVDRAGAPEVARTIAALLQAEELGVPLSRALQGQAEALRAGRRQGARESAARAAPKIQLVVAMVMVPAVLLLVLGVLLIELSRQVGAVVG